MHPKPLAFLILGTMLLASACSIYQSQGRKAFEENAPGRVRTEIGISSVQVTEDCWIQPKADPLWTGLENGPFVVRTFNESQITVCAGRIDDLDETITR